MRLATLIFFSIALTSRGVCQEVRNSDTTLSKTGEFSYLHKKENSTLRIGPYYYDNRLLLNYSKEELDTMRAKMPQKFKNVENYLLRSYVVDTTFCDDCNLGGFIRKFNISEYEKFRKKQKPYVVHFKNGIRVTILPVNSLSFTVPVFQFAKDE